jgi:anti-sigma factor RsiW
MIDEQLEFAISQYADGTLPSSQREALEAHLAADPALVALVEEYRQLGGKLAVASPLPSINWDRLASHLSDSVAQRELYGEPVRVYSMPWVRRAASLAVAACVAIVIGIGLEHRDKSPVAKVGHSEIAVAGPMADVPAGAVIEQISVGPSAAVAMDDSTFRYGESGVVSQPSRVVIASSDAPVQDTPATPY